MSGAATQEAGVNPSQCSVLLGKAPSGSVPPSVPGLPFIGNAWSMMRDPLQFLRQAHATHGDVFRIRAPRRNMVVLAGVEANRWFGAEGRDALESSTFWRGMMQEVRAPHLIVGIDGPDHSQMRRLVRENLSPGVVEAHGSEVVDLLHDLMAEVEPGSAFSCIDFTRKITSLEVNLLLSGRNSMSDWQSIVDVVEYSRWVSNIKTLRKWPRLAVLLPRYRKLKRNTARFLRSIRDGQTHAAGWFRSGIEAQQRRPDLFTEGDLLAHFLIGYAGGVDTVGVTLSFALRELLRDGGALYERVRAEVDDACDANGGKLPPPLELKRLQDLMGTCYETLRLYPAAFGMGRHAARDFEFGGYRVRKGTEVLAFTTGTHTDSAYFPDPYRFDIERFRPPREEHRQKFVFAPYGKGPHVCLGAGMAEMMLPLTLAILIRNYDLCLARPEKEYRTVFDPSTSLPGGFELRYLGRRQLVQ